MEPEEKQMGAGGVENKCAEWKFPKCTGTYNQALWLSEDTTVPLSSPTMERNQDSTTGLPARKAHPGFCTASAEGIPGAQCHQAPRSLFA